MYEVRKVQLVGSTPMISIPIEYGFKKSEFIKVERLDEKSVKLTKIEA